MAGCASQGPKSEPLSSGLWQDTSAAPFSNCYASYHVEQGSLTMIHFFHYQGKPFFETGQGSFKDGVLKYKVQVLQGIDDWPTSGYHELTLSEDGNTLEGFYLSAKGQRGPLKFIRR